MEIGDVYTVEIPPSNGHEHAGARPAIVPLTSRLTAQSFPGTFLIQPDSDLMRATLTVAKTHR